MRVRPSGTLSRCTMLVDEQNGFSTVLHLDSAAVLGIVVVTVPVRLVGAGSGLLECVRCGMTMLRRC